jgi:hypothetical protein
VAIAERLPVTGDQSAPASSTHCGAIQFRRGDTVRFALPLIFLLLLMLVQFMSRDTAANRTDDVVMGEMSACGTGAVSSRRWPQVGRRISGQPGAKS